MSILVLWSELTRVSQYCGIILMSSVLEVLKKSDIEGEKV
jgi:hypothetical protein